MRWRRRQLLVLLFSVALCLVNLPGCETAPSTSLRTQAPGTGGSVGTAPPESRPMSVPAPGAPPAPAAKGNRAEKVKTPTHEESGAVDATAGSGAKPLAARNQFVHPKGTPARTADVAAEPLKLPDQDNSLSQAAKAEALNEALDRLAKGLFFHTIPSTLTAGSLVTIKAGVTQKLTEALKKELQGLVTQLPDVHYDPKGIDIQLKADSADFLVKPLLVGVHPPLVNGKPTVWQWEVTPLRQGKRYLNLTSTVKLTVPTLQKPYSHEVAIAKDPVTVKANWLYSVQQFTIRYGLPVVLVLLSLAVSVFGLVSLGKTLRTRRPRQEEQFPPS